MPEVFFGGARGGGKTDAALGKAGIKAEEFGASYNGIFFRRELPAADDAIERSKGIFGPLGWRYNETRYLWRSPAGARLRFRPLMTVSDAEKYQGQGITDAIVEEAGQYPDPRPIDRLHGVLRSAQGVPTQLLLTGNPGGPGQQWLRARYVEPAPHGLKVLRRELPNGKSYRYVFIPSRLRDNRILLQNDPAYEDRLYLVGSAELVRAWLDGDWDAVEGAYFDCWSTDHVIAPFAVPASWTRFRSFDWGSSAPFSVGWWAVSSGDLLPDGRQYPAGALVRYREWYGASGPGVGLKLAAEEVAEGIRSREMDERVDYGVADPACWAVDGGPSIAERHLKVGVTWRKADNRRVAIKGGPIGGWDMMRARLKGMDGRPMIYTFATCTDSIRTIPMLQHDERRPEDVDTTAEDHAADEWRYACMSRPWAAPVPKPTPELRGHTFDELRELVAARRREDG